MSEEFDPKSWDAGWSAAAREHKEGKVCSQNYIGDDLDFRNGMTAYRDEHNLDDSQFDNAERNFKPLQSRDGDMKYTTGQKIRVIDSRKGTYNAVVLEDFEHDNENKVDQFVDVALDQEKPIKGMGRFTEWNCGDPIPCRTSLALIYPR